LKNSFLKLEFLLLSQKIFSKKQPNSLWFLSAFLVSVLFDLLSVFLSKPH
jgi:hypothetical protein